LSDELPWFPLYSFVSHEMLFLFRQMRSSDPFGFLTSLGS
jgi:hypothetical protein